MKTLDLILILIFSVSFLPSVQADGIPTNGLVAYWEAENNADDSSGTNDGTIIGASYAPGQFGQAFQFGGNDQVVEIPHSVDLQPSSITVAAWIITGSTTGLRLIADKSHGSVGGVSSGWALQMSNGVIAWASGNSTAFPQLNGTISVADNRYHHIAATIDDSTKTMRLYVDGNPDGMRTFTGTLLGNDRPVDIGAWWDGTLNSVYNREFVGGIDDVAIYNRALTQTEIGQLMNHSIPEPSGLGILAGLSALRTSRRRRRVEGT